MSRLIYIYLILCPYIHSPSINLQIHKLLIRVLFDGEEGLEFVQELLSVCVGKTWRLSTVIKDALDLLLLKLRYMYIVQSCV